MKSGNAENKLYRCYGRFQRLSTECQLCGIKSYCDDSRRCGNSQIHRQRTSLTIAESMEENSVLPSVFDDESGAENLDLVAVQKFLLYLATLSPMTLKILLYKMIDPQKSRAEIAAAYGITARPPDGRFFLHNQAAGMNDDDPPRNEAAIKRGENVYLSGPITGISELNYPAFFASAEALERRFDCYVINPAYISFLIGDHRDHAESPEKMQ